MSAALKGIGLYAVAFLIVAFALFPFAWAVISSLKWKMTFKTYTAMTSPETAGTSARSTRIL